MGWEFTMKEMISTIPVFIGIVIFVFLLILVILAILMPFFVYGIYCRSVRCDKHLAGIYRLLESKPVVAPAPLPPSLPPIPPGPSDYVNAVVKLLDSPHEIDDSVYEFIEECRQRGDTPNQAHKRLKAAMTIQV
jgi:hypothetical protein